MSNYTTVAEAAKIIRKRIKDELGANSKQVSVRSSSYSMGSSISVRIKDPSVNYAAVEAIANRQESISRCEYSGEILSGGNRYVSVEYDSGACDEYAAVLEAAFEASGKLLNIKVPGEDEVVVVQEVHPTSFYYGRAKYEVFGEKLHRASAADSFQYVARMIAAAYGVLTPERASAS